MRALWNLILDLFYTTWLGVEYLAGITAPRAMQYLQILFWLGIIGVCLPTIPALIGLIANWGWLVAFSGLLWGFLALLLFILAAPLGILINSLFAVIGLQTRSPNAGRRYVIYTGSILLFGMFFALMASILPWRNNPTALPLILLGAAILAVSGGIFGTAGILGRKIVILLTSIILVLGITSLFFPKSFAEMSSAKDKIDYFLANTISGKIVSGTNYPVCAETERATIVTLKNSRVEIPIYPDCFSGWISIQSEKKVNFRFYKQPENGFLEIFFVDGSRRIVHENQRVWLGHIPHLEFRVRGTQGKIVLSVEPIE